MEWQQTQTSAQHEVWSLIETFEAARRRLDFDQTELRSISPLTTVAVQTYYRVTLQRVDACIDILKNLHTELWRMHNLPLELIHQCTTGNDGQQCNTGDAGTLPPTNESTSLDFDPTWEEIACAAGDVGAAKKKRCVFVPSVRANELVHSGLPNSFPSRLSLSSILPVSNCQGPMSCPVS